MGADYLYYTPCCNSEEWHFEDADQTLCHCEMCGGYFAENELIREDVNYKED